MTIKTGAGDSTSSSQAIRQSDYNQDDRVDHADVEYFLKFMVEDDEDAPPGAENSTARSLLRLQQNGGEVEAADLLEFQEKGGKLKGKDLLTFQKEGGNLSAEDLVKFAKNDGKLTSSNIVTFQKQGGELTADDVKRLKEAGVEITAEDMAKLEEGGVEHTPRFPPGTTYEEIAEMVETGVAISPMDLMGLKDKDGNPMKMDFQLMMQAGKDGVSEDGTLTLKGAMKLLGEAGVKFPASELLASAEAGMYLDGDDLVEYTERGYGTLTAGDLVNLAGKGVVIWRDDLQTMCESQGISLTPEQYMAINPKT